MKNYKYLNLIFIISILLLVILINDTKISIDNKNDKISSLRNKINSIEVITDNPDDLHPELKGEYDLWNRKNAIMNSYLQS